MYICYIDESGDSATINNPTDPIQPMLAVVGLFVSANDIRSITSAFVDVKRKYHPKLFENDGHDLQALLREIKGSDIRTDIRKASEIKNSKVQLHFRFIDEVFDILNQYEVKLISRIWVKEFGTLLRDQPVYSITTQHFCVRFQKFLESKNSNGMVIADFRDPKRNSYVSHSVFTQKYQQKGDSYPSIMELPTFCISDNHALLQMCDLICSTVIYPIAALRFCKNVVNNAHTHLNYNWIKTRYSKRLKKLQYHCKVKNKMMWGITASNKHNPKLNCLFPSKVNK